MLAWLFAGLLASAAAAPRSTSSERTEWVYAQGHATVGPHKDGLVVVLEAENMGKLRSSIVNLQPQLFRVLDPPR